MAPTLSDYRLQATNVAAENIISQIQSVLVRQSDSKPPITLQEHFTGTKKNENLPVSQLKRLVAGDCLLSLQKVMSYSW